ncbi:ThiF family adenylyltransferase [Crossiella sp. SN42]|uniref:HesA/MoeB/ThiF family protein n=1 Tax=Crossiella sp. SN42 TaxID=2944808 RepID=UPI00207C5CA4|nr:ThiF family adenylyltransferase [Crossiella sp. SN42]MCO1575122.1 ThiF family adenylyltransferase [Crossiella sp. SN42]
MPELTGSTRFDRQIAAFGTTAQHALASTTVAVVGLGGVGSFITQALAHLGVGGLILLDPDVAEPSNLNRLIGAGPDDAAKAVPKVDVAARTARAINPTIEIQAIIGSVLTPEPWRQLRSADLVIGAVDGHAPRWALNRLAVQYGRWYADTGVDLRRTEAGYLEAGGHVAVVRPAGPCLLCLSGYDPRAAAHELDSEFAAAVRAIGYRADAPAEPTPSVVFLNQIIAGHAVAELLNWLTPWRPHTPYTLLDLVADTTTSLSATRNDTCPACGPGSPRALADGGGTPTFTTTPAPLPDPTA